LNNCEGKTGRCGANEQVEVTSGRESKASPFNYANYPLLWYKQGIVLRRTQDFGALSLEVPDFNDENFRVYKLRSSQHYRLRLQADYATLKWHLQSCSNNAHYRAGKSKMKSLMLLERHCLWQGFTTFLLPYTLSEFRKMSMYPFSISTDKYVPLQHFDRCTCTPKISYDSTCCQDYS